LTAPSGLALEDSSSAISGQNLFVYFATGQTAASYKFSGANSGNWSVTAVEISGESSSNPIDAHGVLANTTATTKSVGSQHHDYSGERAGFG
jgi:hypothetical protein